MIFDGMVKNLDSASSTLQPHLSSPSRSFIRQETVVPQPSSPTYTHVADKATSTYVDIRHGGAATTVTSLDAGQDSGDIDKTPSIPHDSHLLRVNTLGSDEGSTTLQELTVLCTTLSQKVESLEADLKQTKQVYRAANTKLIIKGRSMIKEIDQDAKVTLVTPIQVSTQGEAHSQEDQPEDQLGVLSATKVLANTDRRNVQTYIRRKAVSTTSGRVSTSSRRISTAKESVSTAGASMPISTAGMIDKGKGIMEESESDVTKTKTQQEQERLGLDTAVRLQEQERVKADEELTQRLQAKEMNQRSKVDEAKMLVDLINQRKRYFVEQKAEAKRKKPMSQAQQRTYMSNYIKHMGSYTLKQLKKLSFNEIKELFEATMRSVKDFVPMESEDDKAVPKLAEARSLKRDAEEELDQGRSKKQKIGESS
nr:hypothetical protein [Tanacetum cinerariifolium]